MNTVLTIVPGYLGKEERSSRCLQAEGLRAGWVFMKAYQALPEGYTEKFQMNLQKDKKTAMKINVGGLIVTLAFMVIGHLIVPVSAFFDMKSTGAYFIRLAVLLVGYITYIVVHELTHGAVMKAVGGKKVVFGFTGMYAFAGSHEDWFDKTAYRLIALAPLVIWGIVFGVLCFVVPREWFWIVWFLQAGNIGGAAGDVYVTVRLIREPATILVKDTGVDMTVYDK